VAFLTKLFSQCILIDMKLLWTYLKNYKKLLAFALVLATTNQLFSLLDPQIFRYIIDNYATKIGQIPENQFLESIIP
jgi:ATP-binding cassette subfamily B protein